MKKNSTEEKFLKMIVKDSRSIPSIAEKLGLSIEDTYDLKDKLELDIIDLKAKEYDKIVQQHGLSYLNQFKYMSKLYSRLKIELDKRDFSGLPTDKLYYILNHVQENLNATIDFVIDPDDIEEDYIDDFILEDEEE